MRVIAGKYRRRILKEVKESSTRSTKDRVKETLFNMITLHTHNAVTLDLFAGSGALGIESLSRGSQSADFVEVNKSAFNVLKDNINTLGIAEQSNIFNNDALMFLNTTQKTFDIIFLDPPYNTQLLNDALAMIVSKKRLRSGGIIITLSAKNQPLDIPKTLQIIKEKTVGITDLKILSWSD